MPSGTAKMLRPAPWAAASAVSASFHGLATPTDDELADALAGVALADADAALVDAGLADDALADDALADADAALADADCEAEDPEPDDAQPTSASNSMQTIAQMAMYFFFMVSSFLRNRSFDFASRTLVFLVRYTQEQAVLFHARKRNIAN